MDLAETVEYWARWQPDALAFTKGDESLTWKEFESSTRRIAAGLQSLGVAAGDRVGILAHNSLAWCELAVATLRVGGAIVPLNVRATPSELARMLDTVACGAVCMDSAMAPKLTAVLEERPGVVRIGLDDAVPGAVAVSQLRATAAELRPVCIDSEDPALIAFTSGTTGYPKGATLSHSNVLGIVETYTRWENFGSHTTALCFAPLAFTGGVVNNLLVTYGVGGRLILEDFDPARALELIRTVPVTAMTAVPIFYESIAGLPSFEDADVSALSTAITGGALVTETLLKTWAEKGVQLRQAYGLTEATGGSTLVPRSQFIAKSDTAGLPCIHTAIRIVDDADQDLPAGTPGEILLRGPQVMTGYWGDEDATREALKGGWLHTGDIGVLDDDGFLKIVDRKKDMIISGGLNVYPAEIERVIGALPGVTEVVAVGVDHERWGETVAVVVGGEVDLDEVYAHAKEHLSDYKLPRFIAAAKEPLPRSMSGKLLRRVIRDDFDPAIAMRTAAR